MDKAVALFWALICCLILPYTGAPTAVTSSLLIVSDGTSLYSCYDALMEDNAIQIQCQIYPRGRSTGPSSMALSPLRPELLVFKSKQFQSFAQLNLQTGELLLWAESRDITALVMGSLDDRVLFAATGQDENIVLMEITRGGNAISVTREIEIADRSTPQKLDTMVIVEAGGTVAHEWLIWYHTEPEPYLYP
jgi:hypothetical protein